MKNELEDINKKLREKNSELESLFIIYFLNIWVV